MEECGATHILFYSICAVVSVFITHVRIEEIEWAFLFGRFRLKKSIFSHCFIQNWEEIESLKNEKSPGIVLEKSWNSVFAFPYKPWYTIWFHTVFKRIYNGFSTVRVILCIVYSLAQVIFFLTSVLWSYTCLWTSIKF